MEDRLWQILSGYARLPLTDCHRITAGRGFRLNPIFVTLRKNQQTSLSTRMLNRCAHERVDQSFQHDLARHRL